ncbi:MAG: type II secretion system F family protein [Pseudomonadales bacterium]
MPTFQYSAFDRTGKSHKGSIVAETERQVRRILREQSLFPNDIKVVGKTKSKTGGASKFSSLFNRISDFELALILRQLGILVNSGLPLGDSLKLIMEQADNAKQRLLVENWRVEITEGRSFSAAMRRSDYKLPEAVIAGIGVGEETGHLHEVMLRMADELEIGAENRQAFRRGLMYPLTLVLASIVAITVMMIWVVPKITRVFVSARAELPLVTKIVVVLSDFTLAYGLYILLAAVLGLVGFSIYVSKDERRRKWHQWLLMFPGIGNWMRMANYGDWSRSLGTMLKSGVPALPALKIASSIMTNLYMRRKMEEVTEKVRRGSSLHQALRDENAASSFMLHMVGSGEASSELHAMLLRVAEYYSARLKASVDSFLKLMNPVLIVTMGLVILVIIAAVMLPILQMNEMV